MARSTCPPGVLCLSGGIGFLIIAVVSVVFIMVAMFIKPQVTIMQPTQHAPQAQQPIIIPMQGGDSRYERAPQPLRSWMAPPELPMRSALPFNIPTQGLPESFQSVGIINVGDQVLPLYGRRTTGGSDRWNYYTRTDSYNPVPLPVKFQKRNCMDDVGCQEIFSGEDIKIDGLKKEGKTDIYQFNGPKYIPGLIQKWQNVLCLLL